MKQVLHLAKDLTLPLEAVSRTFGILAVRGAGKSNTAAVMAEEMFAAGLPFVVVDPVGSWYGLRSSSDGKSAGLQIPIFGGKHGDVPLERGAGELLADLVVEKRLTCVLDLSRFESEGAKKTFLLAFAQRLYLKNENPLHLFLEEADDYIPQKPMRDEAQLLRAWENIVRRGRSRGLGMTIITQRSASVNKMVLTQVETLFAMRTTGPQDIAAIEAWVKYHQAGQEVLSTLASLEDGEAWVWSPHFLKTMSRHQIRRRTTFDSGATPKNVHVKDTRPPATLADIDLSAIQKSMAATIEKAKADDPRELRRQIAELTKQLAVKSSSAGEKLTANVGKRVEVLTDADRALLAKLAEGLANIPEFLNTSIEQVGAEARDRFDKALSALIEDRVADINRMRQEFERRLESKGFQKILGKLATVQPPQPTSRQPAVTRAVPPLGRSSAATRPNETRAPRVTDGSGLASPSLPPGEHATLTAALQYPTGLDRKRLGILTGYKRSSRDAYIARLSQKGLVEVQGQLLYPTDAGRAAMNGSFEPLPSGSELVEYWRSRLPEGERKTLDVLLQVPGADIAREVIDNVTGYKRSSRDAYLTRLKARGLVEFSGRGTVRASAELLG